MAKYRKKPVAVEAFQMTEYRRWNTINWPEWLRQAWDKRPGEGALYSDPDDPEGERLALGTLEGVHRVTWDDWIIRGVQGELYPCKADVFEQTYEKVEG